MTFMYTGSELGSGNGEYVCVGKDLHDNRLLVIVSENSMSNAEDDVPSGASGVEPNSFTFTNRLSSSTHSATPSMDPAAGGAGVKDVPDAM
jgi:hypothetical protein